MKSRMVRGAASIAALLVSSAVVLADSASQPPTGAAERSGKPETAKPDVATILFDTPQWNGTPPGSKIRYAYEKTTADPALGAGFKDDIVVTPGVGDDAESRTAEVQLFSGANRQPAGPFRSDRQNPVLLVVLEKNVQELSKLFAANPRYLKNAIRKAWRDGAKIDTATDTVDGKSVAVTRVAVSPFVGDPEADHMKGLSDMTYVVDVSKEVPGAIVAVDIRAADGDKTRFSETLRYRSESAP